MGGDESGDTETFIAGLFVGFEVECMYRYPDRIWIAPCQNTFNSKSRPVFRRFAGSISDGSILMSMEERVSGLKSLW